MGAERDVALVALLEDELHAFNVEATGAADGAWLQVVARDGAGAVLGGLHGWTWGGCFYVALLWVRADQRRQGLGRRLVQAAEAEAIRRGCRKALVETHSFQAPGFYARLGYERLAETEGYPGASTRLYLRKRLASQEERHP